MATRYTYSVPFTPEQLWEDYVVLEMTQKEVGEKWGVSQKVIWRALKKCGFPTRRAAARNQKRENNNNWKGGRYLMPVTRKDGLLLGTGYVMIYNPEHHHAQSAGYVYEHVLVALEKYNLEKIPDGYCVHHIDLDKGNNNPENLCLMTRKDHAKAHNRLEELAVLDLLKAGKIFFCHQDKTYKRKEGFQNE